VALFTNLFHVGEALAHLIRSRLGLPDEDVVVGPPRDQVLDTAKHLRITLLWANLQPTHRNDALQRNPDGTLAPPPLALSAYYLLTAYGNTVSEELTGAHEMLGDAMRVIHDEPELALPFADLPGRGNGKLGVSLMPLSPELLEKLFGPLQLKHRPFALCEVCPVRLESLKQMLAARPIVMPGGVRLKGPTTRRRPLLERVLPNVQSVGGRVRLDGAFAEPPTHVWIGRTKLEGAEITVIDGARSVSVVIPAVGPGAVSPGVQTVSISSGDLPSDSIPMQVMAPSEPTLDAPTQLVHAKGDDLVLWGRGLSSTIEIAAWPDGGIMSPSELVMLPLAGPASDNQVTVAAASLSALSTRAYRFAARVAAYRFTPFIVLDVTS